MSGYDPLTSPGGMAFHYGCPPIDQSPREPWGPTMTPIVPQEVIDALKNAKPVIVQPPPPSAADSEVNAVNVLAKLTPEERARVLRFAVSKWGPVTP